MSDTTVEPLLQQVRDAVVQLQETNAQIESEEVNKERVEKEQAKKERLLKLQQAAAARRAKAAKPKGTIALDEDIEVDEKLDGEGPVDVEGTLSSELAKIVQTIAELTETLGSCKLQLAVAVQKAKDSGASEMQLLDASRPKAVDIDDPNVAAVAARRARKLRHKQEQERLEKERLEKERLRVARIELRKEGKEIDQLEKDKERLERIAKRKAKALEIEQEKQKEAAAVAAAEAAADAAAEKKKEDDIAARAAWEEAKKPRFGGASSIVASPGETVSFAAVAGTVLPRSSPSRSRSRSRENDRMGEVPESSEVDKGLVDLLWRVSPPQQNQVLPQTSTALAVSNLPQSAHIPLSAMVVNAGAVGGKRVDAFSDMSTGGGEICKQYRIGKCFRDNCKFRHNINRGG